MTPLGRASEILRHLLEIRGVGIIDVMSLSMVQCCEVKDSSQVQIDVYGRVLRRTKLMIVLVTMQKSWKSVESPFLVFAFQWRQVEIFRSLIEAAAMNVRAKRMGYDPLKRWRTFVPVD